MLSDSPTIRASALRIEGEAPRCAEPDSPVQDQRELVDLRGHTIEQLEAMAVRAAWERHGGKRGAIARELGIARSSLLRKLDELGLREGVED